MCGKNSPTCKKHRKRMWGGLDTTNWATPHLVKWLSFQNNRIVDNTHMTALRLFIKDDDNGR